MPIWYIEYDILNSKNNKKKNKHFIYIDSCE